MKQETKELLDYIISTFNLRKAMYYGMPDDEKAKAHIFNCRQDKIQDFLKSIPEIESKLCQGGYIQDKNGKPCCNGDKVRFEFEEKGFKENWCTKYPRVETGELRFYANTKSFCIVFGPDNNGYDWIDFTTSDYGCKWFEKVEAVECQK